MNVKEIIALMMASLVWITIGATVIAALFRPPGTVTDSFRDNIFDILKTLVGAVLVFMGGVMTGKKATEEKTDKLTGTDAATGEKGKGEPDAKSL